jgi:hydroxymethylpyrimidine/phosphomethylpyrimidine kinase
MKRLLVIAGSDSGGGAGIQADIKTATAFGLYTMTAITAVSAQNTTGLSALKLMPAALVAAQIRACRDDIGIDAIKIGMLGSAAIIRAVAREITGLNIPIVLDPVLVSSSGQPLLAQSAITTLKTDLLPLASLVTPNLPETSALLGLRPRGLKGRLAAARRLIALGAGAALIKGGHSNAPVLKDMLVWPGGSLCLQGARLNSRHTHGTGCTYATAIACGLAQGLELPAAVGRARSYLQGAIRTAPGLGHGQGPLNHAFVPTPAAAQRRR